MIIQYLNFISENSKISKIIFLILLFTINAVIEIFFAILIAEYASIIFLDNSNFLIDNIYKNLNLNFNKIHFASFILTFTLIVKSLLIIISNHKINIFSYNMNKKIRDKYLIKYINSELVSSNNFRKEEFLNFFTKQSLALTNCLAALLRSFSQLLIAMSLILLLIYQYSYFSLIGLFFFTVLSYLYYFYFRKKIFNYGENIKNSEANIIKLFSDIQIGLKEIKILLLENYFIDKFKNFNQISYISHVRKFLIDLATRPILEVIVFLFIISSVVFTYNYHENFKSLLPFYTMSFYIILRLLPAATNLVSIFSILKFNLPNLETYNDLKTRLNNINKLKIYDKKFSSIKFENIEFNYPQNNKKIFSNYSVEIEKGDKIFLSGSSGKGKTTLMNIILGLLEVKIGKIILNNNYQIQYEKNYFEKNTFFYLPQKPMMVNDSIINNVKLGYDRFRDIIEDKKAVVEALKKSLFFNDSTKPSDIENTFITDNSTNISGGQAQRIAIARLFYFDRKDFIILDEITNGLDLKTEEKVLNNIFGEFKESTILITSHNEVAKKFCSKIINL